MGIHNYKYSEKSKERIENADPKLRRVFEWVLSIFDHSVITTHRDEAAQTRAYSEGYSKTPWPRSKHNANPSLAADVDVYPSGLSVLRRDVSREIDSKLERLGELAADDESKKLIAELRGDLIPHSRKFATERERLTHFAGVVIGVADAMPGGFGVRWGGDWRRRNDLDSNDFDDLYHFELDL